MYAFYGLSSEPEDDFAERLRLPCDDQGIALYTIGTEIELLLKYQDFEDVFSKEECETVPKGAEITHAIDLEEGAKFPYGPIYALSERELRILRNYLAEKKTIG
jgi:hypothetical protein